MRLLLDFTILEAIVKFKKRLTKIEFQQRQHECQKDNTEEKGRNLTFG